MLDSKKGVSAITAIALFIVVVVTSLVFLQSWYQNFSSGLLVNTESGIESANTEVKVESVSQGVLYLKNEFRDLEIKQIKFDGRDCAVSENYSIGFKQINLENNCTNYTSDKIVEVVLVTDKGVFTDSINFDAITYSSCTLDGVFLNHGDSYSFYNSSSVPMSFSCSSSLRTCMDGVLSGDSNYVYGSCSVEVPFINYSTHFVSIWDTSQTGISGNNQITLPLESSGTYNFDVYWGDGTSDTITSWNQAAVTHTYPSSGTYTVNITGTISGWTFSDGGDKDKILDISQWGSLNLGDTGYYFQGCSNLDVNATDALNLTGTTTLGFMFSAATSLTTPDFTAWDTSGLTSTSYMFSGATNFNGNISTWDMSNVGTTWFMFSVATSFNGNISSWDMSSLTAAGAMFYDADSFNQDLSGWDVGNLLNVNYMFNDADIFNGDISSWDTSNVTNMDYMFEWSGVFDQDLSGWNVDQVTTCADFSYASSSSWSTIEKPLFTSCTSDYSSHFISTWDTTNSGTSGSNQISLPLESSGTYNFDVDWGDGTSDTITSWNQTAVTHTYPSSGIYSVVISGVLSGWRFNNLGDRMKIIEISQWGSLNLGNNDAYFYGAVNLDISATDALNLTGTTSLKGAFFNADSLTTPDFSSWDVSSVTSMRDMFRGTLRFNGNISEWDTGSVNDLRHMFNGADGFNQDLSGWDVSSVTNMRNMFYGTDIFNGNISSWNVSNTINMLYLFRNALAFNQDLSGWDVNKVTNCLNFDSGASSWVLSKPNFTSCTP